MTGPLLGKPTLEGCQQLLGLKRLGLTVASVQSVDGPCWTVAKVRIHFKEKVTPARQYTAAVHLF